MHLAFYLKSCNWCLSPTNMTYNKLWILLKVDGGYTTWSAWGACSQTCGNGFHTKTRTCTNPQPQFNGLSCFQQNLGPESLTEVCKDRECPSKTLLPRNIACHCWLSCLPSVITIWVCSPLCVTAIIAFSQILDPGVTSWAHGNALICQLVGLSICLSLDILNIFQNFAWS